jgi:hypothetical protein
MNMIESLNLFAGWWGVTLGVFSGGVMGLLFHREDWLGGYGSWSRRMVRLGHISFFGLAFLNFMFAFTVRDGLLSSMTVQPASILFLAGAITMPLVCFLSAWRKPLRHLFPVPVLCISGALVCVLVSSF